MQSVSRSSKFGLLFSVSALFSIFFTAAGARAEGALAFQDLTSSFSYQCPNRLQLDKNKKDPQLMFFGVVCLVAKKRA